jgi:AraC-like DNA-binding protein
MNISVDKLHLYTLNVGQASHHGDWNWKNVRSPFARIFYVTEGSARVEMPSGTYELKPDYLYYIPAFTTHSYECEANFSLYYIHVYEEPDREQGVLEEWELPFEVEGTEMDRALIARLCEMNPFLKLPQSDPAVYDNHPTLINNLQINQRRPFCDKVESRGILFLLFSRFLRIAKPKVEVKDDRIHQVLTFIRKNLDKRIDVDMLSNKCCMSKDHFIRVFKHEMGVTPNLFVIQKKMERSELLLVTTAEPLKAIADALGYDDYSYFNRIFKKHIGLTPQQYREKYAV